MLQADCFLICYAVNDRTSLQHIWTTWLPEVRNNCPNAKIVLVGTKLDLRQTDALQGLVAQREAIKMKEEIKAYEVVECSAKNKMNLDEVFNATVRAVRGKTESDEHSNRCCCCTIS